MSVLNAVMISKPEGLMESQTAPADKYASATKEKEGKFRVKYRSFDLCYFDFPGWICACNSGSCKE